VFANVDVTIDSSPKRYVLSFVFCLLCFVSFAGR